ncbi:MAG: UUP1 family membrane protein [Myxococcales bacterium]|nr:UUP1 family membrane protein [Myxococcales bacterium]
MARSVAITGLLFVLFGAAIFGWKTAVYGLPLAPSDTRGLWQVELRISVRGQGRQGSVTALLPAVAPGQRVLDERSSSDRLRFSIRARDENRTGVWTGWLEDVHEIVYEFRVQTDPVEVTLPSVAGIEPPAALRNQWATPTPEFPSSTQEVRDLLEALRLPPPEDGINRVRTLFAFVTHEVATVETAGDDATLTLTQREGSETGKARLLVTLLRGSGIPARLVRGLELRARAEPVETVWTEAWVAGTWIPMSSVDGFFASRPAGLLSLGSADLEGVESTGARAVGYRYRSLRERLRPEEVALAMAPDHPALATLSLYNLPVGTQSALRSLLVLPLGALLVALLRNVVGIPTYGTFMPLLIAFALRGFPLSQGLALVTLVLTLGVTTRLALERLRLLMVPRLSILLCVVILVVTALAIVGDQLGNRDLFAGIVFPIVILTMLVERFSIAIAEEGLREALLLAGWSLGVAVACYPVLRSPLAEHLMFTFPELVVALVGVLVWIGGYTGYRVSDLLRFRSLANEPAGVIPR